MRIIKGYQYNKKLMTWALEHKKEWDIVCGIRITGIETNMRIMEMLKEEGFNELKNMIACRIYQCFYDDIPEHKKIIKG